MHAMRFAGRDDGARSIVRRAFRLLGASGAGDRALTLAELATRTGIPKPSVHRLAGELLGLGALERGDVLYVEKISGHRTATTASHRPRRPTPS
jgi:DNA-binding IclR family transcriptional regulator